MVVVVIDDDPIYRFTFERTVKQVNADVRVQTYENGQEAINHCTGNQMLCRGVDLVLVDLNMPVMDGWQFLDEFNVLAEKWQLKAKVYIVSSSTDPKDLERQKNYSCVDGYLVKPVSREKLKELLQF